jgi:hypothetical protein
MDNRNSSILYGILGIYSLLISWHYNHSILLLIIHYIFWPIYLIYELLITPIGLRKLSKFRVFHPRGST